MHRHYYCTVYLPASASQVTAHERQQVKPSLDVGGWTTLRWLKWLCKGDYVIASRKQRDIAPEKMDLRKRKGSSSNHQFSGANCRFQGGYQVYIDSFFAKVLETFHSDCWDKCLGSNHCHIDWFLTWWWLGSLFKNDQVTAKYCPVQNATNFPPPASDIEVEHGSSIHRKWLWQSLAILEHVSILMQLAGS